MAVARLWMAAALVMLAGWFAAAGTTAAELRLPAQCIGGRAGGEAGRRGRNLRRRPAASRASGGNRAVSRPGGAAAAIPRHPRVARPAAAARRQSGRAHLLWFQSSRGARPRPGSAGRGAAKPAPGDGPKTQSARLRGRRAISPRTCGGQSALDRRCPIERRRVRGWWPMQAGPSPSPAAIALDRDTAIHRFGSRAQGNNSSFRSMPRSRCRPAWW